MTYLDIPPNHVISLSDLPDGSKRCHEFDAKTIGAVNAALAAGRPLLVRGEPGLGKTQLAEAVATQLKRAYLPFVVDSRTEQRDLLWHYDAVERLAEAQLCHVTGETSKSVSERLKPSLFVRPGPLWWALDWESAQTKAGANTDSPLQQGDNSKYTDNGWVLLLDEIDKAESDVPNGLLEALGAQRFTPFDSATPVIAKGVPPLVIITTNEERTLPPAFIRRCLVLVLELPQQEEAFCRLLAKRGQSHFGDKIKMPILEKAAKQLFLDRQNAIDRHWRPLPGQAEYIDLLRVLAKRCPNDKDQQLKLLEEAAEFIFRKPAEL